MTDNTDNQKALRDRLRVLLKAASLRKRGLRSLRLSSHWEAAYDELLEDLSIALDGEPKDAPLSPEPQDGVSVEPGAQTRVLREIVSEAAAFYGIAHSQLMGPYRERHSAEARHVAIYFAKRYCSFLTLMQLGDYFGRDHSTIISAIAKVETKSLKDSDFAGRVKELRSRLIDTLGALEGCELATAS